MTTKFEMKKELERCYRFLKGRANSRGLITVSQERLANDLAVGLPKFNRLVHRLEQMGLLRLTGGGRQPKTISLTAVDADGVVVRPRVSARAPDEGTAVALRLFDAVCEAVGTMKM